MADLQDIAGKLAACCRVFDGSQRKRKHLLLRQAARCALDQPSEIQAYHECLLFVAAFPDDRSIHRLAEFELSRLASASRRLGAGSRRAARFLRESGVPGSATSLTPSFDLLQWLMERFPGDVDGAWTDDSIGEELEEFMHVLAARVEYDGTVDLRLSMRQWLGLDRGRQPAIHWLAARLAYLRDHHRLDSPLFNAIFDHLNLDIWWQLRHGPTSRTLCRFPPRNIFLHAPRTHGPTTLPSLATIISQPLRSVTRFHGLAAQRLIETARCALPPAAEPRASPRPLRPQDREDGPGGRARGRLTV